jgi:hemolysin III
MTKDQDRDDGTFSMSDRLAPARERIEDGFERLEDKLEHGLDTVQKIIKPKLRGWLHAGTFPLAVLMGAFLVLWSPDAKTRVSTAIFAVTAALLFGVSALYHTGRWGPRTTGWLQRFDHANIFLIIAGTYTPFSVLLLPPGHARVLLWIVWTGAVLGVAFRVLWVGAPRWLYVPVYIALGWVAVAYLPQFWDGGGPGVFTLVLVGGAFYTVGAVIYGLRRPTLSPRVFGFHELFHAFTVVAFLAHYIGVSLAVHSEAVSLSVR